MKVRMVAFAAIAVALTSSSCARRAAEASRVPPAVVDVVSAARRDLATSLTLDAQITPSLNAMLSSPQSGNVTAVYVDEGERVHGGQLLAKIDDAPLRAELEQAEGQLTAARGKLEGSAVMQPIQSKQYTSTFSQAQARLNSDRAAEQNARLVYESDAKLYPQGYISQTTLEQARASYVAAAQQVRQDQAALRAAQASLGQSQADLLNVEANQGLMAQAHGLVRQLHTEIAQTSVYAPFDGTITARLLDPGSFAGPNAPILALSHLDIVYIIANVPDDALQYVRVGEPVTFTTASLPGKKFQGTIFDINATPTQGTLSYRARVRYSNSEGTLRGGMLANVIVPKEMRKDVVVVPRSAIFQADGGNNVFLAQEGKAVRSSVQVGLQTDTLAEVRGLRPGAQVITARPDSLQNGSPIVIENGRT